MNIIILSAPRSTKQHISYGVPLKICVLSEIMFIIFLDWIWQLDYFQFKNKYVKFFDQWLV
jgi:hypothetical protein